MKWWDINQSLFVKLKILPNGIIFFLLCFLILFKKYFCCGQKLCDITNNNQRPFYYYLLNATMDFHESDHSQQSENRRTMAQTC